MNVLQAYGAKEYKLVGLVFQRCLAFSCLYALAIAVLYSQSQWVFSHLGQARELALAAGQFLLRITPTTLLISPLYCLHKYWAAQRVTLPGLVAGAVSVFVAPIVFWFLIFRWVEHALSTDFSLFYCVASILCRISGCLTVFC